MLPRNRPPTHPGEMLLEEFLNWLNGQRNWDLWHAFRSEAAEDLKTMEPVGA